VSFEKDVTVLFLEMLIMVKLYHWKTSSYATHKATDELYTNLNANIDKFIEVLLGKAGNRINLMGKKNISLITHDLPSEIENSLLIEEIENSSQESESESGSESDQESKLKKQKISQKACTSNDQ
jgi:DNA-binding ferritin-like protein